MKKKKRRQSGVEGKAGIDRKRENKLVLEYQETGSESVFLEIYEPRKSTFKNLASRFYYVSEDMESEMHLVFMKAIMGFRPNCRSFNTYFYTAALNHVKNMQKAKRRNKRTLEDGTDPSDSFLYLDDSIEVEGGSTYHDIISTLENGAGMVDAMQIIHYVEGRSWILLDIIVDMMGSGKPPVKRKEYESVMTLCGDGDAEDQIEFDVGIPRDCYQVIETDVIGNEMRYVVDVSRQRAYEILVDMVSHFNEGDSSDVVV